MHILDYPLLIDCYQFCIFHDNNLMIENSGDSIAVYVDSEVC